MTLSHPEVVEFIRRQGNEVFLLVLDEEARVYYEQQSIIPTHTMPEVKCIRSWEAPPKLAVESVGMKNREKFFHNISPSLFNSLNFRYLKTNSSRGEFLV